MNLSSNSNIGVVTGGRSGAISGDNEIVVIGSQSILGSFPDAPAELLFSCEADVYPKNKPTLAILIDGAIGEESDFK